jgi:hypothetical protein
MVVKPKPVGAISMWILIVNVNVLLSKYIVHPSVKINKTLIITRCTVQLWKKRRLLRSKAVCTYPLVLLLRLSDKFTKLHRIRYDSGRITTVYFLFLNSVTWNDNTEAAPNPSLAFGTRVIKSDADKAPTALRARRAPWRPPNTQITQTHWGICRAGYRSCDRMKCSGSLSWELRVKSLKALRSPPHQDRWVAEEWEGTER